MIDHHLPRRRTSWVSNISKNFPAAVAMLGYQKVAFLHLSDAISTSYFFGSVTTHDCFFLFM